jgi:hypothetical protein
MAKVAASGDIPDRERVAAALTAIRLYWLMPTGASGEEARLDAATDGMLTLLGLIRQRP